MSTESGAPYARVERSLWTEPGFRAIPADARLVYLYLLTGPHSHMSGLSHLSVATIADDLDLELAAVRDALAGPLADLVEYDDRTRELFVVDAGRMQLLPELKPSDKRWTHVTRHLAGIHSERLKQRFLEVYGEPWNLSEQAPSQAPSEGPSQAPSEANSKSSSKKQEQEQEQQQPQQQRAKHETEGASGETAKAGLSTETDERQRRSTEGDADVFDIIAAAKLIANGPKAVERWETWIEEKPDERALLARGLRIAVDTGQTSWSRGTLFDTPNVFASCPGLRGQAESAYRNHENGQQPRRGGFSKAELDMLPG